MALYGMANNNVIIPAERDGALYNFLLGGQDYVFEGIGDEFEITPSSSSFLLTLGNGEGVVCGRHVTEAESGGSNSMIQLEANSSGYVVIRVDLSRPAGTEAYLYATPALTTEDLNNAGTVHDLPLYQYQTNSLGVSSFADVRNISAGSNVVCELSGGALYVYYYEDGTVTKKQVGSLDPATLTATPADVKSGKVFGGADSDEPMTGTFAGQSKTVTPGFSAVTVTPDEGKYLTSVTVNAEKYGYAAQYHNSDYAAITNQVITATNCLCYAIVVVKAGPESSNYPPTLALQGCTSSSGTTWEDITLNPLIAQYGSGGPGGAQHAAWYTAGTFSKRYAKVRLSRPQNSVYSCYTQIFLFR